MQTLIPHEYITFIEILFSHTLKCLSLPLIDAFSLNNCKEILLFRKKLFF
jgi:hypothetical protein